MSTETAVEPNTLNAEQVRAMRHADTVIFRFGKDGYEHPGIIELKKQRLGRDGFGPEEANVKLTAPASISNYGASSIDGQQYVLDPATSGDWVLLTAQFRPEWTTLARFVKPRDRLIQEWVVDNRNTLLRQAGLTIHELKLRVDRDTKHGTVRHTFLLDAGVEKPGRLAERVRRERRS